MPGPLTIPITKGATAAGGSFLSSVPWGGIGQFLSGAGAIGGLFGGGDSPSLGDQRESAFATAFGMPTYTVAGAKKAGLHPLAVLGANMSGGGSTIVGQEPRGSASDALTKAGAAMTSFGKAKMEKAAHAAALLESQGRTRQANAAADKDKMMAEAAWSEMRRAEQANQYGVPLYQKVYDQRTGTSFQMPNYQELGLEAPESVGGYYHGKSQLYRGADNLK